MPNDHTSTDKKPKDDAIAPLKLNPEDYRDHLNEFDLTQAQQDELLGILWNMMEMMDRMGWGLD